MQHLARLEQVECHTLVPRSFSLTSCLTHCVFAPCTQQTLVERLGLYRVPAVRGSPIHSSGDESGTGDTGRQSGEEEEAQTRLFGEGSNREDTASPDTVDREGTAPVDQSSQAGSTATGDGALSKPASVQSPTARQRWRLAAVRAQGTSSQAADESAGADASVSVHSAGAQNNASTVDAEGDNPQPNTASEEGAGQDEESVHVATQVKMNMASKIRQIRKVRRGAASRCDRGMVGGCDYIAGPLVLL